MRTVALAALGLILTVASPAVASADSYGPGADPVAITVSPIETGTSSTVTGEYFEPGCDVVATVSPSFGAFAAPGMRAMVGLDGTVDFPFIAPEPGEYTFTLTEDCSSADAIGAAVVGRSASTSMTVTESESGGPVPAPEAGGSLPATGSDSGDAIRVAAVITLAGVGLLAVALRRRNPA